MNHIKKALYGIMAGGLISIATVAKLSVQNHFLGALLFSSGVLAIFVLDLRLFTGGVGKLVTVPTQQIPSTIVGLFALWFENFFGCWIVAQTILSTSRGELLSAIAYEQVRPLLRLGPWDMFMAGIYCNIVIYVARKAYAKTNNAAGAIVVISAGIIILVCHFEHSVIDSFYVIAANIGLRSRVHVLAPIALGNGVGGIFPALVIDREWRVDNG